jgi:hypothetical protein
MGLLKGDAPEIPRSMQSTLKPISLFLTMLVSWALTHHYTGLGKDGSLYAVQALARVYPSLYHDLSLANDSQDRYTIFSAGYGYLIRLFGLPKAEMTLFVLCTSWFLFAAWVLSRNIGSSREIAWTSVAMLIITVGHYGAYGIFNYSETYLTARSLSEALIVTSLATHFAGRKLLAVIIAAAAMLVHPLMALPGLLLLISLSLPFRYALLGAATGLLATVAIASFAATHALKGSFAVFDPAWLEIVRERSQFLFLDYWGVDDWELHLRVFTCLGISAIVIQDARVRRFCSRAALVGASGLGVAFIASFIGPVAILVQGQAWRWFWVSELVCVVLLAATALTMWSDKKCGPLCALLLISGWTFAPIHGSAFTALALGLWLIRSKIDSRIAKLARYAAYGLALIILIWTLANIWSLVTAPRVEVNTDSALVDRLRSILALEIPAFLVIGGIWYILTSSRTAWVPGAAAACLVVAAWLIIPGTFGQPLGFGSSQQIAEFADWRNSIPDNSNVLMIGPRKTAAFIWFTLERPSYLSVDQSSGVVFSRDTALEIRRRSEVLLPVQEQDWRILSMLESRKKETGEKPKDTTRPLTHENLVKICRDPQLNFVAARESVGFEPIRHLHTGSWKDWNLYNCQRVRSASPSA